MKNLFVRKRIANFTNRQVDEFLQRVIKASDSLNNEAFSKYLSKLNESAKAFHDLRMVMPPSQYTKQISETCRQADEIFRKIKITADYSAVCLTGQEQEAGQKVKTVISFYGNIPFTGTVKKFVDYDSFVNKLSLDEETVKTLNLKEPLEKIADLTKEYRETNLLRDTYRQDIKGRRKAARIEALEDYTTLRDYVEGYATVKDAGEVSTFVGLVNEALINVSPNKKPKEKETLQEQSLS